MRTLIRGARVFDGARTLAGADILIDDDRIAEPDGQRVDVEIDGTGRTVLPGLIDAHTHVFDGTLAQALSYGVTTELDMNCMPLNLARQRRLAAARDDVADLRSSGIVATALNGHPTQVWNWLDPETIAQLGDAVGDFDTVASADQATEWVQARVAEGVDYVNLTRP